MEYANKVEVNGETIIDLSKDTIVPETLDKGITAHDATGKPITGTFTIAEELNEQDSLITQIQAALIGKVVGGDVVSEEWTFTLTDGTTVTKTVFRRNADG